ncbi:UNVERIFIED_CONTAM: hypothetical protein GTU68_005654, partial [Idotea baltica]|nr:hypothetical protein [Idotea baltica]
LHSNAHFIANEEGAVDLAQSPSVGGSFKGLFPSGLLSVASEITSSQPTSLKYDTQKAIKIKISLQEGHRTIGEEKWVRESLHLERRFMSPGVRRIPVKEGRVRGVLFLPEGNGPFPGVIDMFGATPVPNETRAALNASRGIASLYLPYFKYDDIPYNKLFNLDLEYFEEALQYLLAQPTVIPQRCGLIVNCYAVFLGFMMTSYFKEIKAAVFVNGPAKTPMSELSFRGKLINEPCVGEGHYFDEINDLYYPNEEFIHITSVVDKTLMDTALRSNNCKFLIPVSGADTFQFYRVWNNLMNVLPSELARNFTLKIYPRAGHFIHPPNSPFLLSTEIPIWSKVSDEKLIVPLHFGGHTLETYNMQAEVWKDSHQFITTHLQTS